MKIHIERHDEKNKINKAKHGIDFETAQYVLNDPLEIYDIKNSIHEDR
jgi:uncharacterized DUF497 family protein